MCTDTDFVWCVEVEWWAVGGGPGRGVGVGWGGGGRVMIQA